MTNRVTRSADKIVSNVPTKITPMYERSPYHVGTQLWNELSKLIQESQDMPALIKIDRMNRVYVKLLLLFLYCFLLYLYIKFSNQNIMKLKLTTNCFDKIKRNECSRMDAL